MPRGSASTDKVCVEGCPGIDGSVLQKGRKHPAPWFRLLGILYSWSFYIETRHTSVQRSIPYCSNYISVGPQTPSLTEDLFFLFLLAAAFLKPVSVPSTGRNLILFCEVAILYNSYLNYIIYMAGLIRCRRGGGENPVCI